MTNTKPLKLLGAPGSPYTRKMLAVLRYRMISYQIIWGGHHEMRALPKPKVNLLPTFYFERPDGQVEAAVDSTPLIRRLEKMYQGRSLIPHDPALAFLDELLEDYADEWLTKAMFHYRWHYKADIDRAGAILPRWRVKPTPEARMAEASKFISERQIARLYVVGSNNTTAPVIEASYKRFLDLMVAHLDQHSFLLGNRPAASDFGIFGQLTQLTHFDPTPMQEALDRAPRVYAWVDLLEDLSGLEPADADWLDAGYVPDTLKAILAEVGRCYVPVMLANARALISGAKSVELQVDGLPWVQEPFPYQGRCVQWLRESYARLDDASRQKVDRALAGTGCELLVS